MKTGYRCAAARTLLMATLPLVVACESPADLPDAESPDPTFKLQGANEPAGYTSITDRPFDAKAEHGWTATDALSFTIETDDGAPRSPSSVGQMLYPSGCSDGCDPGWTSLTIAGLAYTSVYTSFWIQLSSNWQGHDSHVNKVGYVWVDGGPDVYFAVMGKDDEPLTTEIRTQGTPEGDRNLAPNVGNAEIVRGQWHHWEAVLVNNTGDDRNGEAHWWIDGVKVGEYVDLMFTDSTQGKVWEILSWRPIWGGRGDVVLLPMYMRMDHYYASGAP